MNEYNNCNGNYSDPYSSGVYRPDPASTLSATASVMGVLAIASAVFMPLIVPSLLGGMAVILAVISKGKNSSFSASAKRGAVMGAIALALHIVIVSIFVFTAYKTLSDPVLRDQANEITEQVYGYSFDDMLKILDDDLGTKLYEMDGSERQEGDTTPAIPGLNDVEGTVS